MNRASSGATRRSPAGVTAANVTCLMPWRYVVTRRAGEGALPGEDRPHVGPHEGLTMVEELLKRADVFVDFLHGLAPGSGFIITEGRAQGVWGAHGGLGGSH